MTFSSFEAQVEATCLLPSSDAQAIAQLELAEYINAQAIAVICPQEDLLDKAFDELTPSEWEQLKQYQPEIEIDRGSVPSAFCPQHSCLSSMTETNKRRHKRIPPKQMRYRKSLLIEKYGMKCFWCECTLLPETITIDHYIPLSKGGNNKLRNLRLACARCNNFRGNSMPEIASSECPHGQS